MVGEVANWCLANGLTVAQTDALWDAVRHLSPPATPSDFIEMMQYGMEVIRS